MNIESRKNNYEYVSHLDDECVGCARNVCGQVRNDTTKCMGVCRFCSQPIVAREPVRYAEALKFARHFHLARNEGVESALFVQYPELLGYLEREAALLAYDEQHKKTRSWHGLLRHLEIICRWTNGTHEEDPSSESMKLHTQEAKHRRDRRHYRARSTKSLGERVDEEIGKIVNGTRLHANKTYRYTKWLLMYLYERQWMPLSSQLPLWLDDNTVRTSIDIVCFDISRRVFLIVELKTGYAFNYFFERARPALFVETEKVFESTMVSPNDPSAVLQTSYSQHQMQLGWMQWRLEKELVGVAPVDGYVVRVNSRNGVSAPFVLEEFAKEFFRTIYEAPLVESTPEEESVQKREFDQLFALAQAVTIDGMRKRRRKIK